MKHKLCGLVPYRGDEPVPACLSQLSALCDSVVILVDNCLVHIPREFTNVEVCLVDSGLPWNDWHNRVTLLARAAAHDCPWVCWLDDDERFEAGMTRARLDDIIDYGEAVDAVGMRFKVKEMWDDTHWRSDGIWNNKGRVILQKNPMMLGRVEWNGCGRTTPFHNLPSNLGSIERVEHLAILHYGMSTPEKRKARQAKWEALDPANKYQTGGYSYMTDETGMELTAI